MNLSKPDFDVGIFYSLEEIGADAWDALSAGRPFQSYHWYAFGEKVMSDCAPVYIILSQRGVAVARATFWVIRNEPLPIAWRPARHALHSLFHRWPLFVCRSPFANTSGLILPDPPLRQPTLETLINSATGEAYKHNTSFIIFDYMYEEQTSWNDWPTQFTSFAVSEPGTMMEIKWSSFDQYLAQRSQKTRKHYRQYNREAEKLGIHISHNDHVTDIKSALVLIRNIENRYHSSPNPWVKGLLENANLVGATWLTAKINNHLVGCELILEDNGTQMITSLGLARDVSHIYFLLGYEDIRYAIKKGARVLRWGSGAYEVKQRLGFQIEPNNFVVFMGVGNFFKLLGQLVTK